MATPRASDKRFSPPAAVEHGRPRAWPALLPLLCAIALLTACRPTPTPPAPAGANVSPEVALAALTPLLAGVVRDGLVDYPALTARRAELEAALAAAAHLPRADFDRWPTAQRLAFLLNLYNAHTLALLAANPGVASIKDISGEVWKRPFIPLFGQRLSLDQLEHDLIRKEYREPAIHFALVCGAKGCPPLRAEPYRAADLGQQLLDQGRRFLGDDLKNRVDRERRVIRLSPIFKWYREDFGRTDAELFTYLARHLPPDLAAEITRGGYTIEYTDYDWSLNSAPARPPAPAP